MGVLLFHTELIERKAVCCCYRLLVFLNAFHTVLRIRPFRYKLILPQKLWEEIERVPGKVFLASLVLKGRTKGNKIVSSSNMLNYNGPSMNPILKAGDQIRVVPYASRNIRVGDVVVFQAPEGKQHVTHRVISVDSRGVRTRGDNNNNIDSWILQPEEITGRVDSALRGAKRVPIHGGRRGMMYASALRSIKRANLTISRMLRPAYHRLLKSGIFRRAVPNRARPRVICFLKPNGVEMHLLMGRWMIGRCRPGLDRWWIRRPFKLFVDENSLPENQ